jgi:hypothetical protein
MRYGTTESHMSPENRGIPQDKAAIIGKWVVGYFEISRALTPAYSTYNPRAPKSKRVCKLAGFLGFRAA